MFTEEDKAWMQHALLLADKAQQAGEVPVGAVLVQESNVILGEGYNQPISTHNPCAHAEVIALQNAARHIQNYRLVNTTLYVTLEPCLMCVGAMVHARIRRVVYAAPDPKTGVVNSAATLLELPFLNHKVEAEGGLLADEAAAMLRSFFQARR